MIHVSIPAPLKKFTGGAGYVEAAGATVTDLLADLEQRYPGVGARVIDEHGEIRHFVTLFLNDEDIRALQGVRTPLKDGDRLAIIPAIAGG